MEQNVFMIKKKSSEDRGGVMRGFDKDEVLAIKRAYKVIYRNGNTIEEAIDALEAPANDHDGVARMVEFLRHAERGIIR